MCDKWGFVLIDVRADPYRTVLIMGSWFSSDEGAAPPPGVPAAPPQLRTCAVDSDPLSAGMDPVRRTVRTSLTMGLMGKLDAGKTTVVRALLKLGKCSMPPTYVNDKGLLMPRDPTPPLLVWNGDTTTKAPCNVEIGE
jgi:hypothetical protein